MADKNIADMSYKEAAQELELIVRNLEGGDMELEQSLESYARGVALIKSLRARLDSADQQVSVLLKDIDGNDVEAPASAASTDDKLSF